MDKETERATSEGVGCSALLSGCRMSDEEQRIAIAEACEIEVIPCTCTLRPWRDAATGRRLPDYLSDLNAMHAAEELILNDQSADRYARKLSDLCGGRKYIFHSSSRQRAEAFLRTVGKWKE